MRIDCPAAAAAAGRLVGYDDVESTSRPMEASRGDGSLVSLADALRQAWPNLQLPSVSPTAPSAPPEGPESTSEQDVRNAAGDGISAVEANAVVSGPRVVCVLIDGVRTSLELPIAWLHARMHAADHFLYVTVHAII